MALLLPSLAIAPSRAHLPPPPVSALILTPWSTGPIIMTLSLSSPNLLYQTQLQDATLPSALPSSAVPPLALLPTAISHHPPHPTTPFVSPAHMDSSRLEISSQRSGMLSGNLPQPEGASGVWILLLLFGPNSKVKALSITRACLHWTERKANSLTTKHALLTSER